MRKPFTKNKPRYCPCGLELREWPPIPRYKFSPITGKTTLNYTVYPLQCELDTWWSGVHARYHYVVGDGKEPYYFVPRCFNE